MQLSPKVLDFINDKEDVKYFLSLFKPIIKEVHGDIDMELSICHDYEEGWSSLRIDLATGMGIDEALAMEGCLFVEIEKNQRMVDALEYITISCS